MGLSTGTQARSVSQQPQQRSPLPPPPPPPTQQQGFAFGNSAAGVDVYAAMGGMLPFPGAYGLPMMSPLGAFFQPSAFGMGMTTPAGMMNQVGPFLFSAAATVSGLTVRSTAGGYARHVRNKLVWRQHAATVLSAGLHAEHDSYVLAFAMWLQTRNIHHP